MIPPFWNVDLSTCLSTPHQWTSSMSLWVRNLASDTTNKSRDMTCSTTLWAISSRLQGKNRRLLWKSNNRRRVIPHFKAWDLASTTTIKEQALSQTYHRNACKRMLKLRFNLYPSMKTSVECISTFRGNKVSLTTPDKKWGLTGPIWKRSRWEVRRSRAQWNL